MIPAWVLASLTAAVLLTLRFSLQKSLKGVGLSSGGATFSRFLFAAPLAAATAALALAYEGTGLPGLTARFWLLVVAGGTAQIVATLATVALFSERAFAVGIAFTKSETLLVAAFSALILGEAVSVPGFVAILTGFVGVLVLSVPASGRRWALFNRASALGLLAGATFGLSAIGYRGATLEIAAGTAFTRAAVTLAAVTAFQTVAMGLYLRWREPGELTRVVARWRMTALVGVTGMAGSLMWFTAFALENAAYVRAVGQVDLAFSILVGWALFHERIRAREWVGIALLLASVLGLILVV